MRTCRAGRKDREDPFTVISTGAPDLIRGGAEKYFTSGARFGAPYRKDFSARFASVEMTVRVSPVAGPG